MLSGPGLFLSSSHFMMGATSLDVTSELFVKIGISAKIRRCCRSQSGGECYNDHCTCSGSAKTSAFPLTVQHSVPSDSSGRCLQLFVAKWFYGFQDFVVLVSTWAIQSLKREFSASETACLMMRWRWLISFLAAGWRERCQSVRYMFFWFEEDVVDWGLKCLEWKVLSAEELISICESRHSWVVSSLSSLRSEARNVISSPARGSIYQH